MRDADALAWLLEPDNPSACYLALTGLLARPEDDPEVAAARAAIPGWGPAKAILDAQWPEGYWMQPGVGYSPKHKATVWQVIFLAALGAPRTEPIDRACSHVLDRACLPDGRFSESKTAKGGVLCLNGNLLRALLQLGYEDARIDDSIAALAKMVVQDGFCCRYNAPRRTKQRPEPVRRDEWLPCAWGAIKALAAFALLPAGRRSLQVQGAIKAGIDLLLGGDPARGDYPTGSKPSPLWSRLGFPLGFTSDLLEALEVLGQHGAGGDPRLAATVDAVRSKADDRGRWALEYTPQNTWAHFGEVGQANKWVTLRALLALDAVGRSMMTQSHTE